MSLSAPAPSSVRYLPQLDSLRCFAVAAVLVSHFSPTVSRYCAEAGTSGVRLFFVLSGFLITGILLRSRDSIARGTSTVRAEITRFFARRTLRIFPPFYALLFANLILNIDSTRADFWWHATYLSNIYIGVYGRWPGLLSHLWSLAVEEQFYLLWPWLVVVGKSLSPRTWILGAICAGPIFRLGCQLVAPDNTTAHIVFTPGCMDALGAGALLAWHRHASGAAMPAKWRRLGLVLVPLALLAPFLGRPGLDAAWNVFIPSLQAFAFAALVDGAATGFTGLAGRVFLWTPFLWVGRVSYGVYLYHNNAHWLGPRILHKLTDYQTAYFSSELLHVLYLSALSLAAAAVSWFVLERPLNRLKDRLPFSR